MNDLLTVGTFLTSCGNVVIQDHRLYPLPPLRVSFHNLSLYQQYPFLNLVCEVFIPVYDLVVFPPLRYFSNKTTLAHL